MLVANLLGNLRMSFCRSLDHSPNNFKNALPWAPVRRVPSPYHNQQPAMASPQARPSHQSQFAPTLDTVGVCNKPVQLRRVQAVSQWLCNPMWWPHVWGACWPYCFSAPASHAWGQPLQQQRACNQRGKLPSLLDARRNSSCPQMTSLPP